MELFKFRSYIGTFILIAISIIVFIIQGQPYLTPDILVQIDRGSNFAPYSQGEEPWRLLTSMFVHVGLLHLAINMAALYILGTIVEGKTGTLFLIALYLITGLFGSMASVVFNLFAVSAGASGAIFGIYGFHMVDEFWQNRHDSRALRHLIAGILFYLLLIFLLGNLIPFDHAGHLGGLVTGVILGIAYTIFHLRFRLLLVSVPLLVLTFLILPDFQVRHFNDFQLLLKTEEKFQNSNGYENDMEAAAAYKSMVNEFDSIATIFSDTSGMPGPLVSDRHILEKRSLILREEASYMNLLIEKETYRYLDSLEIIRNIPVAQLKFPLVMQRSEEQPEQREQPQVIRIFYDSTWRQTSRRKNAVYYRLGMKDSLGRWTGRVEDYFMDGSIQMKGTYTADLRDGIFRYYRQDSTYDAVGRYEKEYRTGKWENFHENGQLNRITAYRDRAYLVSAYAPSGDVQVENGDGVIETYYSNGTIKQHLPYTNGLLDGRAFGRYADGSPKFQEKYETGRFILGESYQKDGTVVRYDESSFYPNPTAGYDAFNRYVRSSLESMDRNFTPGTVKLLFSCAPTGEIFDIRVFEGINPGQDSIAVKLLENGPGWYPARDHGLKGITSEGITSILFQGN